MADRLLLLVLLLSITCPAAWAQDPAGAEFRVNSYTTSTQGFPAVASDANGNFVVVWEDNSGHDGSSYGVFGQRFNAAGLPLGSEFQVNSYTTSQQRLPAVASDANGNFVVVWASVGDGVGFGVFGQRFNAGGLPQGPAFQVNTYAAGNQLSPAVGSDANGNFVVVWESFGQDGSSYGVFGQRFHAFGLPQASEFQVNSYTTSDQSSPAVTSDANGNFVAVWQSRQKGSSDGVFGQRFNASGVPQAIEFRANTSVAGAQVLPAVGSDANGNFVVAWGGPDGSAFGVFGQRFNAGGLPQGPEFKVNSYTTSSQLNPAVASAANGNFVAVWRSSGQDGSLDGVFGQRYGDLIFQDGFE